GYAEAVRHYDAALKLVPGIVDGSDTIGQDAAWNRAIALERIEEEKKRDAGNDASPQPDGSQGDAREEQSQKPDGSNGGNDGGSNDKNDAGRPPTPEGGSGQDADTPKQEPQEAGPPPSSPPPSVNQDERMLDMLESAPTFQQQDAKNRLH